MRLTRIEAPLDVALARFRDEVSEELLGGDTARPFAYANELEPAPNDPLAWTDITTGELGLAPRALEQLASPVVVAAIAHQVIHAIGEGPAFAQLEEQLLEEAIVETLTQTYLADFVRAFGGALDTPPELFAGVNEHDVTVTRPTAANVAVERFGRLAAWLEDLDGTDDPQDLEAAALKWATRLKATPGAERFGVLAREAARLGGDDDDVDALDYLEEYLRGYMRELARSHAGFSALEFALSDAWGDDDMPKLDNVGDDGQPWRVQLAELERAVLEPLPTTGAINRALRAARDTELEPALERSLDARGFLWAARSLAAAAESPETAEAPSSSSA